MKVSYGKAWVKSIRRPGWDYRIPSTYLVTICTNQRQHWFGEIQNGIMGLSDTGCVVAKCIQMIPWIRPYVNIVEWVVMPNHIHIIIRIRETWDVEKNTCLNVDASHRRASEEWRPRFTNDASHWDASTINRIRHDVSLHLGCCIPLLRLSAHSLGSIMNQLKSVCTKRIRKMGYEHFAWQPRFHDRMIRDEKMLRDMKRYVRRNPEMWWRDRNN